MAGACDHLSGETPYTSHLKPFEVLTLEATPIGQHSQ